MDKSPVRHNVPSSRETRLTPLHNHKDRCSFQQQQWIPLRLWIEFAHLGDLEMRRRDNVADKLVEALHGTVRERDNAKRLILHFEQAVVGELVHPPAHYWMRTRK